MRERGGGGGGGGGGGCHFPVGSNNTETTVLEYYFPNIFWQFNTPIPILCSHYMPSFTEHIGRKHGIGEFMHPYLSHHMHWVNSYWCHSWVASCAMSSWGLRRWHRLGRWCTLPDHRHGCREGNNTACSFNAAAKTCIYSPELVESKDLRLTRVPWKTMCTACLAASPSARGWQPSFLVTHRLQHLQDGKKKKVCQTVGTEQFLFCSFNPSPNRQPGGTLCSEAIACSKQWQKLQGKEIDACWQHFQDLWWWNFAKAISSFFFFLPGAGTHLLWH